MTNLQQLRRRRQANIRSVLAWSRGEFEGLVGAYRQALDDARSRGEEAAVAVMSEKLSQMTEADGLRRRGQRSF